MASALRLRLRVSISVLILASVSSPAIASLDESGAVTGVTRSTFPFDGDVAWVVQVSDLHISAYEPSRAADLASVLGDALGIIRPDLLLITGDITDAKNKRRTSSRQDEAEWAVYRHMIDNIVDQGVIDKHRIFDIRGNHDKYGVPSVGGRLDFFSTYSVSSQLDRLNNVNSILLQGNGISHLFLGIDDTMAVGIRYPTNLFGHPSDKIFEVVDSELGYWNNNSNPPATKVVFGHFPLSFTASNGGRRYKTIFSRQSISAFICGHLHAKFRKLWMFHQGLDDFEAKKTSSGFWEWELGDWKDSRLIRILAVDNEAVSFIDFPLKKFDTTILITHPTDSRTMISDESSRGSSKDINALVFSDTKIKNVSAWIFDSYRGYQVVEEIPLWPPSGANANKPLFHAKWNAENYKSMSATRYWLQVVAVDVHGKKASSERRPFSVEGLMAIGWTPWSTSLLLGVCWEDVYMLLLCGSLSFLLAILFLPIVLRRFIRSWSHRRAVFPAHSSTWQTKIYFWLAWFLLEGSSSEAFICYLLFFASWMILMPWFWGQATSEDGDLATMYISGWRMAGPNNSILVNTGQDDNTAYPDIMVITLPYLYVVLIPMVLLFYALFSENAYAQLTRSRTEGPSATTSSRNSASGRWTQVLADASMRHLVEKLAISSVHNICDQRARRIILVLCFSVALIHLKMVYSMMLEYGTVSVALSPISWVLPLFLAMAVHCTGH